KNTRQSPCFYYFRLKKQSPQPTWIAFTNKNGRIYGFPSNTSDKFGYLMVSSSDESFGNVQKWISEHAAAFLNSNDFRKSSITCLSPTTTYEYIIDNLPSNVPYSQKSFIYIGGSGIDAGPLPVFSKILTDRVTQTSSVYSKYSTQFALNSNQFTVEKNLTCPARHFQCQQCQVE
ncbi:unnamed protein product, partial [Didymodactylos carnosus]